MAFRSGRNIQRPVIGVTGNHKTISPSWWCIRLSVYLAGGEARRISVRHEVSLDQLHGIVISGGDDIHPSLYGGENQGLATYDTARDELEIKHIQFAVLTGIPILGICRGYQLINVVHGGSLFSDIRSMRAKNLATIFPRKKVFISPGSKLSSILRNSEIRINALHHQAVDRLARGFQTVAVDTDSIYQGIESAKNDSLMGVQWHPEYLLYIPAQLRIFRWLVDRAQQYSDCQ